MKLRKKVLLKLMKYPHLFFQIFSGLGKKNMKIYKMNWKENIQTQELVKECQIYFIKLKKNL